MKRRGRIRNENGAFTTRYPHGYTVPEHEGPPEPMSVLLEQQERYLGTFGFEDIDSPAEEVIARRRERRIDG